MVYSLLPRIQNIAFNEIIPEYIPKTNDSHQNKKARESLELTYREYIYINRYYFIEKSQKISISVFLYALQWRSDSALKTGGREMLASIPGRACQPSCSEFSVVLVETLVNTG